MPKLTRTFLHLALLTTLSGCGTEVCIAGFGQCAAMFANTATTTSTGLVLTGPSTVTSSVPVSFIATGGTGIYTYAVISPVGCGVFPTASSGLFTPGTIAESCTLQVSDTTSPTPLTGTILITIAATTTTTH